MSNANCTAISVHQSPISLSLFFGSYYIKKNKNSSKSDNFSGEEFNESGQKEISPGAIPLLLKCNFNHIKYSELLSKIDTHRQDKFQKVGIALPEIKLVQDNSKPSGYFEIFLYQESIFEEIIDKD